MPNNCLKLEIFNQFVKRYRDRYGEHRMSETSLKMWYSGLRRIKGEKFEKITTHLLGVKEIAFGWGMVLEHLEIMFPAETDQQKLDRKWESGEMDKGLTYGSKEVRKKMLENMAEIIGGSTGIRRKGSAISQNWREDYADFTIELLGKEGAIKNARTCNDVFPWFAPIVIKRINNQ